MDEKVEDYRNSLEGVRTGVLRRRVDKFEEIQNENYANGRRENANELQKKIDALREELDSRGDEGENPIPRGKVEALANDCERWAEQGYGTTYDNMADEIRSRLLEE